MRYLDRQELIQEVTDAGGSLEQDPETLEYVVTHRQTYKTYTPGNTPYAAASNFLGDEVKEKVYLALRDDERIEDATEGPWSFEATARANLKPGQRLYAIALGRRLGNPVLDEEDHALLVLARRIQTAKSPEEGVELVRKEKCLS